MVPTAFTQSCIPVPIFNFSLNFKTGSFYLLMILLPGPPGQMGLWACATMPSPRKHLSTFKHRGIFRRLGRCRAAKSKAHTAQLSYRKTQCQAEGATLPAPTQIHARTHGSCPHPAGGAFHTPAAAGRDLAAGPGRRSAAWPSLREISTQPVHSGSQAQAQLFLDRTMT